jgi:hypothetical protein
MAPRPLWAETLAPASLSPIGQLASGRRAQCSRRTAKLQKKLHSVRGKTPCLRSTSRSMLMFGERRFGLPYRARYLDPVQLRERFGRAAEVAKTFASQSGCASLTALDTRIRLSLMD